MTGQWHPPEKEYGTKTEGGVFYNLILEVGYLLFCSIPLSTPISPGITWDADTSV